MASLALGAETDNFTGRHKEIAELPDSLAVLDQFTNQRLAQAITDTNLASSCDVRLLYLNVWGALGKNPVGEVERFAEDPHHVKNYLVDFNKGIYGAVPTFIDEHRKPRFADLFILTGWFDSTIRLNGQVIGIDKLGHFFGQGWEYFQAGDLKTAFLLGDEEEKGMDGYVGSGVYSYGDLSSNIEGLKFWTDLTNSDHPYVSCEKGKYVQKRLFSWKDYVTPAWDEALNCSKYVSPEMDQAVSARLKSEGLSCPVDPTSCAEMVKPMCSNYTVSPSCFKIAGVSIQDKAKECEAHIKNLNWDPIAHTKLRLSDFIVIKIDTLWNLMGLSAHFIHRDWKLKHF